MKLGIEIAKNAVAALPMSRVAIDARRRRHELKAIDTNDPERSRGIFAYQEAMISRYRSISGRLLEIGPGRSLGVAALFVKAGCSEAIAIDVDPRLDATEKFYEQLDVADALERVAYVCPMPLEKATFPDGYFDLIVSHVVAEYLFGPGCRGPEYRPYARAWGRLATSDPSAGQLEVARPLGLPASARTRLAPGDVASARTAQPLAAIGLGRRFRTPWSTDRGDRGAKARTPSQRQRRERFALEFRTKWLDDLSIYNARILAIKRTA